MSSRDLLCQLGLAEARLAAGELGWLFGFTRSIAVFRVHILPSAQAVTAFMYTVFSKAVTKLKPLIITGELGLYCVFPC